METIKNILNTIKGIVCAIIAAILTVVSIPIFIVGFLLLFIAAMIIQCALYLIGEWGVMKENGVVYESKHIVIEELPNGMFIHDKAKQQQVQVGDLEDIDALIESLLRLKQAWYSGERYE